MRKITQISLLLISFLMVGVLSTKAQVLEVTSSPTIFELTKANITTNDFITSTDNWTNNKTYCGVSGDFFNMSSATRIMTITVKNVESFDLSVQNSTAGRIYSVEINGVLLRSVTHGGGNCETETFTTGNTGEITITLKGNNGSVYPSSITFYTPSTPAISAFTVPYNGEDVEATIDDDANTITAELPYGANLTSIEPVVAIQAASSYTPTGAQDFTNPVVYDLLDASSSILKSYTVTITASPIASSDATLNDLLVDGETVTDFDPATISYTIEYPYGTTDIPVVAATVNDPTANITNLVQATSMPGTATVEVTAQDASTNTYTINFTVAATQSSDATLSEIQVDGVAITAFDPETISYTVEYPYGTTDIPVVAATVNDPTANITDLVQATTMPGTATIEVTAQDGSINTYTINFTVATASKVLTQVVFNNSFDAFIQQNAQTVEAYYLDGTTTPTISTLTSNSGATVAASADESTITITGEDSSTKDFTVSLTAVTPFTVPSSEETISFDGTESWIKGGYGHDASKGWKFAKAVEEDGNRRISEGKTRIYFFIGACDKLVFKTASGISSARAIKVYVNETLAKSETVAKYATDGSAGIEIDMSSYTDATMVSIVSDQTGGDGGFGSVVITPKSTTSIENIENSKTAVSAKYYSLTGIEVNESTTGVIIVKTTYDDGSVETTKVIK